ncbi:MAG: hypothetical protein KGJ27_07465 [candidate division NC10 bacterium]|nr:hypothetical protein [candidate division NC10 bacterium]
MPKERSKNQRLVGVCVLFDGQGDLEGLAAVSRLERREAFAKPAGTSKQIDDRNCLHICRAHESAQRFLQYLCICTRLHSWAVF